MITRTYISKFNTIIKDSQINCGINPISELCYGANVTRMLVYFDVCRLKEMVNDKIFPDITKMKHRLKITNASSIDFTQVHCNEVSSISDNPKLRASSFDLIFFLIPKLWDGGKGFDYTRTFFNQGYYAKNCGVQQIDSARLLSTDGSNWYQSRNGYKWDEEGIYSNLTLSKEYDKFSSDEGSSIIIGRQHFDVGNEDIDFDITDIVNKFITDELENYGIGIAYSPMLENTSGEVDNYIGFITHKNPSFFDPYVETYYDDFINDDRANFILNKKNRLYLYCNIGGNLENLDEMPTCKVNDEEYEVKQFSKGVYYIDIMLKKGIFKPNTMLYDVWGNIVYKGEKFDDIELDFVLKSNSSFFNIGDKLEESVKLTPNVYGIREKENINKGDIRKVVVMPKVTYGKNVSELVDNMEYRLYIHDGEREIDIIPYEKVNKTFVENNFVIDTNILLPNRYYVDIRFKYNMEMIQHKNLLSFDVVDKLNNKYN